MFFVRGQWCATSVLWIVFSLTHSRYSILPVIFLNGILHLNVSKKSYTTKLFNDFVNDLLNFITLYCGPNSVLIIDNASVHHSEELWNIVKEWYAASSLTTQWASNTLTTAVCTSYTFLLICQISTPLRRLSYQSNHRFVWTVTICSQSWVVRRDWSLCYNLVCNVLSDTYEGCRLVPSCRLPFVDAKMYDNIHYLHIYSINNEKCFIHIV